MNLKRLDGPKYLSTQNRLNPSKIGNKFFKKRHKKREDRYTIREIPQNKESMRQDKGSKTKE